MAGLPACCCAPPPGSRWNEQGRLEAPAASSGERATTGLNFDAGCTISLYEEDTTLSNTSIVEALIDIWNRMDWDATDDLMAEGIFYHSVPMEPFEGRAAAGASIRGMGCVSVHWDLLSIAENGDEVLTERADRFELANGRELSVPIMGTFEIENGRMQAWRDYSSAATVASQMA